MEKFFHLGSVCTHGVLHFKETRKESESSVQISLWFGMEFYQYVTSNFFRYVIAISWRFAVKLTMHETCDKNSELWLELVVNFRCAECEMLLFFFFVCRDYAFSNTESVWGAMNSKTRQCFPTEWQRPTSLFKRSLQEHWSCTDSWQSLWEIAVMFTRCIYLK